MSNRPNIIIFNPDQWRSDVMGHMGDPAAVTPNLDAAVNSDFVSFRNAFCQNPVCTPSRCSFMSGWYPHVRGHRTMFHMLHPDRGEPVLLKTLKDNGYHVWWGGKNDLVPGQNGHQDYCHTYFQASPEDLARWGHKPRRMFGYDRGSAWRGEPGSDTYYSFMVGRLDTEGDSIYCDKDWQNVLGARDFLLKRTQNDQPFCLYLPLTYPHPEYAVEDPFFSKIDRNRLKPRIPHPENWEGKPSLLKGIWQRQNMMSWSEDRWKELRATYYGMCARVDHQFGLLMQALKHAGLYDNTAVFVFSDHGDFTGDYGLVEKTQNTFEDVLTRVPFLVKPPAGTPCKPRISDAMVELIDFPATVEALTGIAPQHTHFGRSLLPILPGDTDTLRDAVFCEGGRLHGETHCMEKDSPSATDPKGLYWPRTNLQSSEGPEHTKAVMCRTHDYKYVRRLYESDELYDLRTDPGEVRNLINDPAYRDILQTLRDRMLTFFMETADAVPWQIDQRNFRRD